MTDNAIKVPQWALPIAAAAVSPTRRSSDLTAKKAQANGQAQAVTSAKVEAIVSSLERQEKIQEKTNEQIAALVQALLAK